MSDNFGSDSFTETTHTSWLSRIGQSIKGVLVGIVLIGGSSMLLFWNEGRAVQTARSLTEGAGVVVAAAPAKVEPANDGKLVHVSGETKAVAPLTDPEFGVSAQGLRLVRAAEMYQWKEESKTETRKNLGGSEETVTTYSYVRTWDDSRIDSSKFRRPAGHSNPEMRYRRFETIARDASLGAFKPGPSVLGHLSAGQEVRVEPAIATATRERLRRPASVVDGKLYLGLDAARPQIGDQRISFRIAANGPVSIVGRQAGSDFAAYQTKAGDRLLMVRSGLMSAGDMFKAAEADNRTLTWILRFVGAVLMFIGFGMILRPLVVVADLVPLIGDILGAGAGIVSLILTVIFAPLVIAVAWFWYRPFVAAAVIVGGLAVAYGLKRVAASRAATRRAAAGAT
jgi:Transmembrane protein 43